MAEIVSKPDVQQAKEMENLRKVVYYTLFQMLGEVQTVAMMRFLGDFIYNKPVTVQKALLNFAAHEDQLGLEYAKVKPEKFAHLESVAKSRSIQRRKQIAERIEVVEKVAQEEKMESSVKVVKKVVQDTDDEFDD